MLYMKSLKDKSIGLFFSYKVSLNVWDELGMIGRESKIWDIFGRKLHNVFFITYGNKDEIKLKRYFPNVKLLNNKWNLHPFIYSILLPIFYKKELLNIDIYKVNQLSGALPAVISKVLYKKKLIIRCGFQLSFFLKKQRENNIKIFLAFVLEWISYRLADLIIVTSFEDREYIITYHKIKSDKIRIIPNGVDTELFNILDNVKKEPGRILFVARLIKQKNLFSLLEAMKYIEGVHLVIIGKGYLKEELVHKAQSYKTNVTFIDKIRNEELPIEYNKSQLFILPSFFEGNPKVLLEAMACGLPVICTDISSMSSIVQHTYNGILCKTSTKDIKDTLLQLLNNERLRVELGRNARNTMVTKFSLHKVLEQELMLLNKI